jgi:hypothetical protein
MTMADVIETQPGANPGRVSFTTALEAAGALRLRSAWPRGARVGRAPGEAGASVSGQNAGGGAASFRGAQRVCRAALFCTVTGVPFASDTA